MRKILFSVLATIFLIVVYFLLHSLFTKNSINPPFSFPPTPTPISGESSIKHTPLYILSTQPKNNETEAPINKPIIITFNQNIILKDLTFTIKPTFDYSTSIQDKELIITPKTPLLSRATYQYFIDYSNGNHEQGLFTTAGEGQVFPNKTSNIRTLEDNTDIRYAPDVYLSNRTGDNTNPDYSISYDYTPHPQGHFYFTVTSNVPDQNQAKQEFLTWLYSIGLTDQQMKQLDIIYR